MVFTTGEVSIKFTESPSISSGPIVPDWSYSKTFTVENESDITQKYDILIKDLINTFESEGYLQYKITCTSGNGYTMTNYEDVPKSGIASDTSIAYSLSIEGNATQEYTIEFIYRNVEEDQSMDMGKQFSGLMGIGSSSPKYYDKKYLYGRILADHPTVNTRTNFNESICGEELNSDCDTTGVIYKETTYKEKGLDVYYFAGNPQDNWVSFAGYYWRIIRTNEDGSVRLLYAGTSPETTVGYITSKKNADTSTSTTTTFSINGKYDNTKYVGYMYSETPEGEEQTLSTDRGNTISSGVKEFVDNWYANNIANNSTYNNMVSTDAIYCNDRSGEEYVNDDSMEYAAYKRLDSNPRPTYQCGGDTTGGLYSDNSLADKFSKTTGSGGNGALTYSVGLMTADEIAFVGGRLWANSPNTYYYRNSKLTSECTGGEYDENRHLIDEPCSVTGDMSWLTLSPFDFELGYYDDELNMLSVNGSTRPGRVSFNAVNYFGVVRPVLSLKSDVLVTGGNGTAESPYTVKLEN